VAIHAWRQPGALPFDTRETLIVEALLRGTTMGWLPRLLALPVFAAALWGLAHYPFANVALGAGLAAYAALGLWRPTLMLFLTPPWLALVNLAPWSGSLYLEDYDLFLATTLGVLLVRGLYATRIRLSLGEWIFLGLLTLSYGISMARGLLPLPEWNPVELSSYYSQWNALRLAKGFFWALLLFPGLVALFRLDQSQARSSLVWGLALAGGLVGVVAMWERGVFQDISAGANRWAIAGSLLDFSTPYRITGLFSEMHTGGEAIDGFIALVWPFAVLAVATSRSRHFTLLGILLLVGTLYAGVATFSRATYLALITGTLAGTILWFLSRRDATRAIQWQVLSALPGLLTPLALAFVFTRGGLLALVIGLAGWAGNLASGYFSKRGGMWPWIVAGIFLSVVSAWGMAGSMASSKWVANTPLAAQFMGGIFATLVGLGGLYAGRRLASTVPPRGMAVLTVLISSGIAIVTPALLGTRMDTRLATTTSDMDIRLAHWRDALAMMDPDIPTTLFGMGIGRFPSTYIWNHRDSDNIGSYRFVPTKGGHHLALGGGQDLRFMQRVSLPSGGTYSLSLDARTDSPSAWLHIMLYRRHMIMPNEWPGRHIKFESDMEGTGGKWIRLTWTFNVGELGDSDVLGRPPLVLELMNWRKYSYVKLPGTVVEIDNISLRDSASRELLANGDFSRGLERWFPHYDFNHLPWHVKNLWVNVYFDQGVLGVLGLAGFLFTTILAAMKRGLQGDPWGLAVSASMASFLAVGLFGGLLDMPRIIFICYLMLFVTALSGPIRKRHTLRRGRRRSSPITAVGE